MKIFSRFFLFFSLFFIMGCQFTKNNEDTVVQASKNMQKETLKNAEKATFAGGCFWCIEPSYQENSQVIDAVSGFSGGSENATYKEVSTGKTKHREAVQVFFDPKKISYKELVEIFWRQIDPTDPDGQFGDRGFHYTTAIFYHNEKQKQIAEQSKKELEKSGKFKKPIATKIIPFKTFFLADDYHQDFYKKSAEYYKQYKKVSGRADFIEKNWAKKFAIEEESKKLAKKSNDYNYTDEEIQEKLKNLDPLAYHVVAENGTEKPFENKYWDNKADGIYVDIVTGKPLFSSTHKYDSGSGWPSFWRTIDDESVTLHEDNSLSTTRTEIRSESGHVGHVFDDGPTEKTGKRFCTNSASLRFVPKEDLKKEGYERYLKFWQ